MILHASGRNLTLLVLSEALVHVKKISAFFFGKNKISTLEYQSTTAK